MKRLNALFDNKQCNEAVSYKTARGYEALKRQQKCCLYACFVCYKTARGYEALKPMLKFKELSFVNGYKTARGYEALKHIHKYSA